MSSRSVNSDLLVQNKSRQTQQRKPKPTAHTAKRVLMALSPYKWQLVFMLFAALVSTVLALISPFMVSLIFDDALPRRDAMLLLVYSLIMFASPIASGVASVGQTYLNVMIGQNVMMDLRNKLIEHLGKLSLRFFTSTQSGEIQSRVFNDASGAQVAMTETMALLLTNLTMAIGALVAMLLVSPLLTLISLVMLPPFLWITYKVGNSRRVASKLVQESVASLNVLTQEILSVSGILLIKTFGRQQFVQERFKKLNQQFTRFGIRQQMTGRWIFMLVNILFSLATPVIYLIAGLQIIHSNNPGVSLGSIVAFTLLQARFFEPITQLFALQVSAHGALGLFDRIFEYMDLPVEIQDKPDALWLGPDDIRGEITFDHVSFTYRRPEMNILNRPDGIQPGRSRPEAPVPVNEDGVSASTEMGTRTTLQDISFCVKPGQLVALVGPSGAGKTTLTYLISRLYDAESGVVSIDGYNVRDIALESLSALIGVVTQEAFLFHASLRQNFLFVCPDATDEQIVAAAKAAAIHDRIVELEQGYDTIAGERGYRLSGGEKQRIAIARVLLKNPKILILDEATSSLDTRSERLIQTALELLMKDRTTIAIAHRLSTILAADMILVVDQGSIVERGTHKELLQKEGLYARLYQEQFSQQLQESFVS